MFTSSLTQFGSKFRHLILTSAISCSCGLGASLNAETTVTPEAILEATGGSSLPEKPEKADGPFLDPSAMMGVESCRDCHDSHVEAWEETKHALSFTDLHERELAQKIAGLLELQPIDIRQEASCSRCHFTEERIHGVIQVEQAVSCESCHGAAGGWIDIHNKGSLSRSYRVAQAAQTGMLHPANVHDVGGRCFDCHVIDSEPLVNVAGHPATSEGFELYSWSQGEMKHNYMYEKEGRSTKRNGSKQLEIAQARKRKLYLSGKLLHLSATLAAIAKSQDPPTDVDGNYIRLPDGKYTYSVQHAIKAQALTTEIRQLQEMAPNKCYTKALEIMGELRLETGNNEAIQAASIEIDDLAKKFCMDATGQEFPKLDALLAKLELK